MNLIATRKVDKLGRMVLPHEIIELFKLNENNSVNIFSDGKESFIIKPTENYCAICGLNRNLIKVKSNKFICVNCKDAIAKLL